MKAAIYSRIYDSNFKEGIQTLFNELNTYNIVPVILASYYEQIRADITMPLNLGFFTNAQDLDADTDFMISLGGDGTLLDTITIIKDRNIPIMGINMGRLGYLAGISLENIPIAIKALANRTYIPDMRTLIHLDADTPLFGNNPYALNEFAILKRDHASMIKINAYLNGEFLNSYWADGLIVATPTGSTAYSLSCGGPVVFPDSGSFVITPVAPHNLNMRPIIVPDNNIISFEVESRSNDFMCALDARREILSRNVSLAVRKESFRINLLRLEENSFLQTLQNKLTWGLDKRN